MLYHAGAEVGQGAHTVFKQFAAEALDVPLEKIDTVYSDTAITGDSGSVSASRMTFMAGNAIKEQQILALEKWAAEEAAAIGDYVYFAPPTSRYAPVTGSVIQIFLMAMYQKWLNWKLIQNLAMFGY